MARTKLSIGFEGTTFRILSFFFIEYLRNVPIGMKEFYGLERLEYVVWYSLSKTFSYLRKNALIKRVHYGKYILTEKGMELLCNVLLKKQKRGLTSLIHGSYLEANPITRQISLKTSLDNGTNTAQVVQIAS